MRRGNVVSLTEPLLSSPLLSSQSAQPASRDSESQRVEEPAGLLRATNHYNLLWPRFM